MIKNRFRIYDVRFMIFLIFVFSILNLKSLFLNPLLAFAKDSSPSATPNSIDAKLQNLEKEIASKAAALKNDVSKKIQNKAYIGQVVEIKDDKNPAIKTFSLMTKNGTKQVQVNEYTSYQEGINKKSALLLKNIAKDDTLVSLGDVDDNGVLAAKKIIRTKKLDFNSKFAIWGQIKTVVPGAVGLTRADNQKFNLNFDNLTSFRLGNDEASIADVKPNNFLISLGKKLDETSSYADFIYLLNPNGDLKINKISSASATPSANPKVK